MPCMVDPQATANTTCRSNFTPAAAHPRRRAHAHDGSVHLGRDERGGKAHEVGPHFGHAPRHQQRVLPEVRVSSCAAEQ